MKENYPIVIVGAGPAGCNFARRVDYRKYDVLRTHIYQQFLYFGMVISLSLFLFCFVFQLNILVLSYF